MASMSSRSSTTSSNRRQVAKRACLSCREKKIKCDGEAAVVNDANAGTTTTTSVNGETETRHASALTCSNCKFLGIQCVFVRSLRGGRRKKRPAANSDEESQKQDQMTSRLKTQNQAGGTLLSLPGITVPPASATSNSSSTDKFVNETQNGGRLSIANSDDHKSASLLDPHSSSNDGDKQQPDWIYSSFDSKKGRPLSPTLSYALTAYPIMSKNMYNQDGSSGQDTTESSEYYDYQRSFEGGPPFRMGGMKRHHHKMFGFRHHRPRHHHGPPGMGRYGGPPYHHGPPGGPGGPPFGPPFGPYLYPPPPPPHLLGYGGPGGPPLHHLHHPPPPPPGVGHGPGSEPPGGRGPPLLPPLDRKDKEYSDYSMDYYQQQQQHLQYQQDQLQLQQQNPQMKQEVQQQQQQPNNLTVQQTPPQQQLQYGRGGLPLSQLTHENSGGSHGSQTINSYHSPSASDRNSQNPQNPLPQTPVSATVPPHAGPGSTHSLMKQYLDSESRRRAGRNAPPTSGSKSGKSNAGLADSKSMISSSDDRGGHYDLEVSSAYPPSTYGPYNTYRKDYYRNSILSQTSSIRGDAPAPPHHYGQDRSDANSSINSHFANSNCLTTADANPPTKAAVDAHAVAQHEQTLAKCGLPKESSLLYLLDLYYHYNHPYHQLLPKKLVLLKTFPISTCTSIYHAIIATVAKFNTQVSRDEEFWCDNVFNYMDDLNTLQMLLSYILVLKTGKYTNNFAKGLEITIRIWELIKFNNLLESCKQMSPEAYRSFFRTCTTRQLYERELLVRLLWDFYIFRVLIFRVRIGYPYNKIQSLETGDVKALFTEIETYRFTDVMDLPIDNKSYLSGIRGYELENRMDWSELHLQLNKVDDEEGHIINPEITKRFLESILLVISSNYLESAADTVSRNGLLKTNLVKLENQLHRIEKVLMNTRLYHLAKDKKMFINITNIATLFILKGVKMVVNVLFVEDIIAFKPFHKVDEDPEVENKPEFLPLINEVNVLLLPDLQQLPRTIAKLSVFQWKCLVTTLSSALDIIKLIELGEGLVPENFTDYPNPSTENQKTYQVCIGVTGDGEENYLQDKNWWDQDFSPKSLIPTIPEQPDSWLQYPDFSLITMGILVGTLGSLIIISKYVTFEVSSKSEDEEDANMETNENVSYVDAILSLPDSSEPTKIEKIEISHLNVSQQLIQEFKSNFLLEKFTTCTNYIKSRTRFNDVAVKDMLTKTEKMLHYIEEILATHSEQNK